MQVTTRSRKMPPTGGKQPPEEVKKPRGRKPKAQTFAEGEAELMPKDEPKPKAERATRGKAKAKAKDTAPDSTPQEQQPVERNSYALGQYGAKKREQERLGKAHGVKVSGDTHEAEHTIGFEPLNQTSPDKRGENPRARSLENKAWAYQEVKPYHRDHIGTGSSLENDASGFNSETYRSAQRSLTEAGDVSSAVQINQLGYAFDERFQRDRGEQPTQIADDSYDTMVTNMDKVTYAQGEQTVEVGVDAKQRAEMFLARRAAQTGRFPTVEEENAARARFGLPPVEEKPKAEEPKEDEKPKADEKPRAEEAQKPEEAKAGEAPPATLGSLCERIGEVIAQLPKDPYTKADPKLQAELTQLKTELRELWNGLADDVRAADTLVIRTLDHYYMNVQHRRPSQDAMYKEQGFKAPPRR